MFKIFAGQQAKPDAEIEKRFTRFETKPRTIELQARQEQFTRYAFETGPERVVRHQPETPSFTELLADDRVAAKPEPLAVSEAQPRRLNDAAHLHANDEDVPLWVFRKALPKRFAAMQIGRDGFVFQ